MRKPKIDEMIDKIPWLKIFLQKIRLRDTRQKYQNNRIIYLNNSLPEDYSGEKPCPYSSNRVCTSKYTLLNFLPKNLYEQFRRIANFYFLLNIILMFLLPDPPKNPYTSMIPLLIVITFTAIKQAYEDFLRHKSDSRINKIKVRVLRNGSFVNLKRKDIQCGDIVEVHCDQSFPCDLMLLHSLDENGSCHVTTANLDGETNLKLRTAPNKFPSIQVDDLAALRGVIKCDKPNADLYEFKGNIEINGHEYPVNNDSVLLAGSTLKIAPSQKGCAIYTGKETKIMLNSKFKMSKMSCIEKTMNKFIVFFLILLVFYVVTCLIGSILTGDLYTKHWYLKGREPQFFDNKFVYYSIEVVSQFSVFSYIIPISLYISIETQRFIGTKFFEWDLNMYDEKRDQPARANNSNVNEDLGQVEYLFTDKTGTLTENEMIFKRFFVNNQTFDYKNGQVVKIDSQDKPVDLQNEELRNFFLCLSLCHSVQVDKNAQKEKYQASSPDEFSFVKFCEKIGVVYEGDVRKSSVVRLVNFFGHSSQYELLHTLEFDSTRKRMSVITKCLESGSIFVFTKGAEDSIFPICKQESAVDACQQAIDHFAQNGWRTLALAFKQISQDQCQFYGSLLNEAYSDLSDKHKETVRTVYEAIEVDLSLIGCTAVEDRLQDGVSSTLVDLRRAGIKIWVLTGDKKQTALNISDSCKHFSANMKKLLLTDLNDLNLIMKKLDEDCTKVTEQRNRKSFAYIVDGKTLSYVFKFELEKKLREV
ncbi:putative phospholipid-transporting ATPase IF, partial [Brachionus plicatilis]